ncbi:MAG: efflux RND transporter periplasmic adaptor subunit [Clostridiales bacterium]|nr:efflux RND transporter periplasmic adaptor subunit [Clostridiales bacterium]
MRRVFAIVVLILLGGCGADKPPEAPALLPPADMADDTAVAARRDVMRIIRLDGRVTPEIVTLRFGDINLPVASVAALPGERVAAGDALVYLDTEESRTRAEESQSQLEELTRRYEYENADRQTEMAITEIELNILISRDADPDEIRLKKLTLDRLTIIRDQELRAQEEEIAYRQSAIDRLNREQAESALIADTDGTVAYVHVTPGAAARPFQEGVSIALDDSLYVECVKTESAAGLNGMKRFIGRYGGAEYELEYLPLPMEEELTYIFDGMPTPARFSFVEKSVGLVAGKYIEVIGISDMAENVLAVPVNAVYSGAEGEYVYVITKDAGGEAVKTLTPVKTGLIGDTLMEITEGLREGDVVYVKQ